MSYLALLFLLLITACQNAADVPVKEATDRTTTFSGTAMTMQYKVIIGSLLTPTQEQKVTHIITDTFNETNAIYNKWNPESELSHLNKLKANTKIALSHQLESLFKQTDLIVKLSNGRFDPTIEPLQNLWKLKLEHNQIPSEMELETIRPAIGWKNIHVEHGFFYKDHDLTQMDLGGIAKGLAIDLIAERLLKEGYKDLFVEWGGEIRAMGSHPENRPWRVFITYFGDTDPEHAIDTVDLNNQAIATSGDYLQNWLITDQEDETRRVIYFHIFDPQTLHPLQSSRTSVASVSVMTQECAFADGLATAAMLFSNVDEAKTWAQDIEEQDDRIKFWIYSRDMHH